LGSSGAYQLPKHGQHGLIGSALGNVDATHCNFDLPERWRGLLLRMILRRELDAQSG
jgi:hypothetical protein